MPAFVAVMLLSACGSSGQNSSPSNPPVASAPSESAMPLIDDLQDYAFYFTSETAQGFRLVREVHQVRKVENDLGDVKGFNSLVMLVDGQLPPFDGDHRTLWNNGTKVNSVSVVEGIATVDLTLGRISLGAESEQRAIDQIVWTLIENDPSVTSVKFTVDGIVSESLAGHVDFAQVFVPAPGFDVLASVWIDLLDRSDVSNPVSITGSACTFEANVAWELTKGGDVVSSGATTAATACPDRSNWSIDLGELAPGNYVLKVSDTSAEDGSLIFEDTKAFTVVK
ncbi:MAG: GerMN domain-containing protein [Actinobacteria bacterium]|nr:GerMN domain-containing protein [Actinomycetota bacterium]